MLKHSRRRAVLRNYDVRQFFKKICENLRKSAERIQKKRGTRSIQIESPLV